MRNCFFRFWSAMLLCLLCGVAVSASEPSVAAIGDRTFPTLEAAFRAAQDGDTVTLLRDIDVKTRGTDGRIKCYADGISLILDGNGHTISGVADTTLAFHRQGSGVLDLTVRSLTVENRVNNATQVGTSLQVNPFVRVTLEHVAVSSGANRHAAIVVQADAALTVTGGSEIVSADSCAFLLNGKNARVAVKNATVRSNTVFHSKDDSAVAECGAGAEILSETSVISSANGGTLHLYALLEAPVSSIGFGDADSALRLEAKLPEAVVSWVVQEKDPGTKVFYGFEAEARRYDAEVQTACADGSVTFAAQIFGLSADVYHTEIKVRGYASFTKNGETVFVWTEEAVTSPRLASYAQLAEETDSGRMLTLLNYINGVQNPIQEAVAPLPSATVEILPHTDTVFRTVGRTYARDGGLACDFSCTGIEFTAYCEGDIFLGIKTTSFAYLTVYVDGVRVDDRIAAKSDMTEVCVARGLERGEHTVMIVNQSQFNMVTVTLSSVTVQGYFTEKPKDRALFFEFYGDSVLCGSNVYLGGTSVRTSDSTCGFGWVASQLLDADCGIIGHGGMGLVKSTHTYRMLDVYKLKGSILLKDTPQYDFARIPDAVIVELGCNDYMNGKLSKTPDVYANGVRQFIGELRALYGADVPIVWIYGYRDDEKDFWATTEATLSALRREGDTQLYECCVSVAYIPTSEGGDGWHPNVETSLRMGEEVAEYLKILLGRKEDADYENSERLGFRNR